ncbi:MAG: fused DSP-PTPase phosphatase/NAD kinase-like protein [Pyrinomonadaceae bacterium]|jgi:protein tyrosine/serine phosphatase|nr:tyrosine-protein phosphatase [Blastocatellia bacterium]MDQ3221321.1 tyrosine-protein phosphatase [Acidobacteriota bacterium]
MIKNIVRPHVAALAFILSLTTFAAAQTSPSTDFSNIKIGNFGQMDERYYRGAQPEKDDYAALAALGVKTVIDLRNDPTDYEKPAVEALGMKYVNLPMSGWKYAEDEMVEQFMKIMNDSETGTVYVHCKAGKHRTGLTGAVYRFNKYGWDYDKAYKEMKNYNYTSWPVHFNIKSYVRAYSKKFEAAKLASAAATQTAAQASVQGTN